jgi:peptidyl-prolyl cis-trans isomerase A (cyclophilin A)
MHFYSISRAVNFCYKNVRQISLAACAILSVSIAQATTVQFQTVMGDFEVNLYDKATPKTVENFLAYVTAGDYKNTVVHRAIPNFVVQAGGFKFVDKLPLVAVEPRETVINEPVFANKRGTIAMAKQDGNPDSATNQWFFNVQDNSKNLDQQNSGFTVFGEITGNGMGIIDSILNLNIFDFKSPFGSMPLQKYTISDSQNGVDPTFDNLVVIKNIVILDANVDTADKLTPVKNTNGTLTNGGSKSTSGGGFIDLLIMAMLISFCALSIKKRHSYL